jgi:ABC-type glutathione transport system ATPase component
VLDEIDVGLDTEHTPTMTDALHGLRERTGCTLQVTTHDLSLARAIADHLANLVNGRIVAHGRPDDVLDGINTTDD